MNPRVERLRAELDGLGAASFLVSDPVNVRHLTGFDSSNAFVLVNHKQVSVLTDGRYVEAARGVAQGADGLEVVQLDRDLAAALAPPRWSPACTSRAAAAFGSRTSWSSTRRERKCSLRSRKTC